MDPRTLVCDPQGRPAWPFLRLWASVTTSPLRGDAKIADDRTGRPTAFFQGSWRDAFDDQLADEPIVKNGLPTKHLIDAWREATQ